MNSHGARWDSEKRLSRRTVMVTEGVECASANGGPPAPQRRVARARPSLRSLRTPGRRPRRAPAEPSTPAPVGVDRFQSSARTPAPRARRSPTSVDDVRRRRTGSRTWRRVTTERATGRRRERGGDDAAPPRDGSQRRPWSSGREEALESTVRRAGSGSSSRARGPSFGGVEPPRAPVAADRSRGERRTVAPGDAPDQFFDFEFDVATYCW